MTPIRYIFFFFFFNDTATTEIYTLSLHDALPIWPRTSIISCRGKVRTCYGVREPSPNGRCDATVRSGGGLRSSLKGFAPRWPCHYPFRSGRCESAHFVATWLAGLFRNWPLSVRPPSAELPRLPAFSGFESVGTTYALSGAHENGSRPRSVAGTGGHAARFENLSDLGTRDHRARPCRRPEPARGGPSRRRQPGDRDPHDPRPPPGRICPRRDRAPHAARSARGGAGRCALRDGVGPGRGAGRAP